MDVVIRDYRQEDYDFLVQCMEGIQGHIAAIDFLQRSKRVPDFSAKKWVDHTIERVKKNDGTVFIAEYEKKSVGCVAGIIKVSTEEDLLDVFPFKDGRIIELFVDPSYRQKNIGFLLVGRMESYFRGKGCTVSELGCLAGNTGAYKLYKKHGYVDNNIEMVKKL